MLTLLLGDNALLETIDKRITEVTAEYERNKALAETANTEEQLHEAAGYFDRHREYPDWEALQKRANERLNELKKNSGLAGILN